MRLWIIDAYFVSPSALSQKLPLNLGGSIITRLGLPPLHWVLLADLLRRKSNDCIPMLAFRQLTKVGAVPLSFAQRTPEWKRK
jgi:hypothetical protein